MIKIGKEIDGWETIGIDIGYYYENKHGQTIFISSNDKIEVYQIKFRKKYVNNPEGYQEATALIDLSKESILLNSDVLDKMILKNLQKEEAFKIEQMKKELNA